ncbi:MAG: YnfA family protein [Ferruginibacter sp.]|nr:YnfA family protein [Cytophagales bacterium]
METLKSMGLFVTAGLLEIGGGYLIWLWMREGKPAWMGLLGAVLLTLYGVVATRQPADFGRVYAAYGGIFIALSILWGWRVDGVTPDQYDLVGGMIALLGVAVMMYAPRN